MSETEQDSDDAFEIVRGQQLSYTIPVPNVPDRLFWTNLRNVVDRAIAEIDNHVISEGLKAIIAIDYRGRASLIHGSPEKFWEHWLSDLELDDAFAFGSRPESSGVYYWNGGLIKSPGEIRDHHNGDYDFQEGELSGVWTPVAATALDLWTKNLVTR